MTTRRTLTFLVLALALFAPATAQADKKPIRTTPKIYILLTDGATNKTVSPSIQTSFSPPKGTTTKAACDGKVTVSAPIGKKSVKGKKKTIYATKKSALKTRLGVCTASAFLPLPASFYGKTVTFTSRFPGNDVVKKFTKTSTFKLVAPPAKETTPTPPPSAGTITPLPYALTKGQWGITKSPAPDVTWYAQVSTGNLFSFPPAMYPPFTLTCPGHPSKTLPDGLPVFDTPFNVNAVDYAVSNSWSNGSENAVQTFTFHFENAGYATGTYAINGTFSTDGGFYPCSASFPIVASAGVPG